MEVEMNKIFTMPWHHSYETLSDEQLIRKAIKKDDMAFLELMKRYEGYFCQIAYRYVKDEQQMLDLIQELTYRGLVTLHQLKEPQYFKTWMTKVLMNLALDELKKKETVPLGENLFKVSQEHVLIEQRLDLEKAMLTLRPDYRAVLELKYFKDLSIEEIASQLGISPNTVKSHLKRGKDALNSQFKEEWIG